MDSAPPVLERPPSEVEVGDDVAKPSPAEKGFQFWAIIATLCVTGILSALENTVVTTSLPTIVKDLNIGDNYIWLTNVFFFTRYLTLFIVSMFTLGSGICGGVTSEAMLIAGHAVQGVGSGGINMIIDVNISDMVPLRERSNYMAMVLTVYSIGTSLGPWIGGAIVDNTSWRWVFYINLPVGGLSLAMLFAFLHLEYKKEMSALQKVKRIDYIGNTILVASTVSVLIALTYGGTRWSWSSARTLTSLILGLIGFIVFMIYENSKLPIEPVTPPRLFKNRTSATVFAITFLNSALLYWVIFFLPVYFQVVLGSSASRSGVQLLPIVLVAIPAAIASAILLAKYGKYKILHFLGFAICTIGAGLFSLLDRNSSTAAWVIYQIIAAWGSGFVLNTLLPACSHISRAPRKFSNWTSDPFSRLELTAHTISENVGRCHDSILRL